MLCAFAECPNGCLNGGHCALPGRCACTQGWTTAVCEGGCLNDAVCVAPGVCQCPGEKDVNGSQLEGDSGKRCEVGPKFWFGGQCKSCVQSGGNWCLKDGICMTGTPTQEICPQSTAEAIDGF